MRLGIRGQVRRKRRVASTLKRFSRRLIGVKMPKSIPAGYREMSPMEGDALKWRYPVLLFDRESGSFLHATVRGVLSGSVKLVTDIGQTVIELTLDNPDFWGDNVSDDATRD